MTGYFTSLTSTRSSQIQEIHGRIDSVDIGVRVFLLWASNCNFEQRDIEFAKEIFKNSKTNSCIVVNCDCQIYSSHRNLLEFSQMVIVRRNIGYDWGGYKDVIAHPSFETARFITIINNSIRRVGSGPLWIEEQELIALKSEGVAGVVESAYPYPHLQSFSLTFSREALRKGILDWIIKLRYSNNKNYVVHKYEVGLAKQCKRLNIESLAILPFSTFYPWVLVNWHRVLIPYDETPKYRNIKNLLLNNLSINPTHALWRFILEKNIPLVKKELIAKNPLQMPDLSSLEKFY